MTIELWFDFNREAKSALDEINEALLSFIHDKDVEIAYRSLYATTKTQDFHAFMHQSRRLGVTTPCVIDLFEHLFNEGRINDAFIEQMCRKYQWDYMHVSTQFKNQAFHHIWKNHQAHAQLKRINQSPTIIFKHLGAIKGKMDAENIKKHLIMMYERETNIAYCEADDCIE